MMTGEGACGATARRRWRWMGAEALLAAALVACGGGGGGAPGADPGAGAQTGGTVGGTLGDTSAAVAPTLQSCALFPANAVFNTRIDGLPVHPSSGAWVNAVGATVRFHADWGTSDNPDADPQTAPYYGIPWNVVSATGTAWPLTALDYQDESDCAVRGSGGAIGVQHDCSGAVAAQARFPFPSSGVLIEGGNSAGNDGDRHVLVVETGACRLWETAYAYPQPGGAWVAAGVAEWDLHSNAMRPDSWTSADAAGLPILPLLARADEAATGEIRHALRVTLTDAVLADRSHIWPATHAAGSHGGSIPFGAVLRLKAGTVIPSSWSRQSRAIAVAMQRYGLYVADNGANLFVQGDPSAHWDAAVFDELRTLKMSDFEFVDTSVIRARPGFDASSFGVPPSP